MHALYGSNLRDARLYHMVLDTTRIPPELCVDALPALRWPPLPLREQRRPLALLAQWLY